MNLGRNTSWVWFTAEYLIPFIVAKPNCPPYSFAHRPLAAKIRKW